jgi:hypothetical protein
LSTPEKQSHFCSAALRFSHGSLASRQRQRPVRQTRYPHWTWRLPYLLQ